MRLVLGTAQFGLDYGVSNSGGRTPLAEVESILEFAAANNVDTLDTAAAYGDAEDVLARAGAQDRGFRIISKTARLTAGVDAVIGRALLSVKKLGRPLDALMVHSAGDLALPDGDRLWDALLRLESDGAIARVGVSFYARDPILDIVEKYRPELAQLPASIVDQRLVCDGTIAELARRGVEIHVRSALHQGLIFVDLGKLPAKLQCKRDAIGVMQGRLASAGLPALDLALSYLGRIADIHAVVVGVTRRAELEAIVTASRSAWPNVDVGEFAIDDPLILDPTAW
jgi:aryl-alcohol dehydrogenase-like predicted oxidoreductase